RNYGGVKFAVAWLDLLLARRHAGRSALGGRFRKLSAGQHDVIAAERVTAETPRSRRRRRGAVLHSPRLLRPLGASAVTGRRNHVNVAVPGLEANVGGAAIDDAQLEANDRGSETSVPSLEA